LGGYQKISGDLLNQSFVERIQITSGKAKKKLRTGGRRHCPNQRRIITNQKVWGGGFSGNAAGLGAGL